MQRFEDPIASPQAYVPYVPMFPKKAPALPETGFIFKQCGFVEDRLCDVMGFIRKLLVLYMNQIL